LDIAAAEYGRVFGFVCLAGLFRDTVVLAEVVDAPWVSAIAASSCIAVDHNLRRKVHIGPHSVSDDVDSIG
jgi:hypothetical protein